ncbi:MAG: PEP-CTERM sorting domain-containing protein [Gammaproteobacteria bacterium]|nr:PEP-CTERM sorting domain-containing protein [Gammaproteobacteria bacterium]
MNFKPLLKLLTAAALFSSFSAHAVPMYIDTAATGSSSPGDSKFQFADTFLFGGSLGTDTDHLTGLFDSMTFGIKNSDNLTTTPRAKIDTLRLDGTPLNNTYGSTESIGKPGTDLDLYIEWDKSTTLLGDISFWFSDPNDSNSGADTLVASGTITSLSATSLLADLDFLYAGFWLDQSGNNLTASLAEPFKIAMGVQAYGDSVDVKAVPEPSIIALFSMGLLGMGMVSRNRRKPA